MIDRKTNHCRKNDFVERINVKRMIVEKNSLVKVTALIYLLRLATHDPKATGSIPARVENQLPYARWIL